MKKYVYSPMMENFGFPRVFKDGKIIEKGMTGKSVNYGRFIDTSALYSSMSELESMRYDDKLKGEFTNSQKAWMTGEDNCTIDGAFAHAVDGPGTYYVIEWKIVNTKFRDLVNQDHSKPYRSLGEAIAAMTRHIGDRGLSGLHTDIIDCNNYQAVKVYHTEAKTDYDSYNFIPIEVTETLYEKASKEMDKEHYVRFPHTNFK